MALTLFKPNKQVKGACLSASFNARVPKKGDKGDQSFYFRMIGQTSWDEKTKRGAFKDGNSIVVKMAPHEISGIIYAIKHNVSLSEAMGVEYVYHDGDDMASIISFEPAYTKVKSGDKWVDGEKQRGFILRVTRKDKSDKQNENVSLAIGFTFAEAQLFVEFLKDGLGHVFNAWYSEEISRYKEAKASKRTSKTEAAPEEEPESEPEQGSGEQQPPEDDVAF